MADWDLISKSTPLKFKVQHGTPKSAPGKGDAELETIIFRFRFLSSNFWGATMDSKVWATSLRDPDSFTSHWLQMVFLHHVYSLFYKYTPIITDLWKFLSYVCFLSAVRMVEWFFPFFISTLPGNHFAVVKAAHYWENMLFWSWGWWNPPHP